MIVDALMITLHCCYNTHSFLLLLTFIDPDDGTDIDDNTNDDA